MICIKAIKKTEIKKEGKKSTDWHHGLQHQYRFPNHECWDAMSHTFWESSQPN